MSKESLQRAHRLWNLARVVSANQRFGGNVGVRQRTVSPRESDEQDIQTFYRKRLARLEAMNGHRTRKRRAELMADVFWISHILRQTSGGKNPNVYQILAVEALHSGLDSDRLRAMVGAIQTTHQKKSAQVMWDGSPAGIQKAFHFFVDGKRVIVPSAIEQFLRNNPGRAWTSTDLIAAIGVSPRVNNFRVVREIVNHSLQLLQYSGHAKRLPGTVVRRVALSVWSYGFGENPPIDYPAVSMHILQSLRTGPRTVFSLSRRDKQAGHAQAGNDNPFFLESILSGVKRLEAAKLIQSQKKKKGRVRYTEIQLTAEAKELLSEYAHAGRLPEKLRIRLMSLANPSPRKQS